MLTKRSRPKVHPTNVLRGVDWDSDVRIPNHPGNGHLRMSYLHGTLILMSPEMSHDRFGRRLAMIIDEVTEALRIFVEPIATTTLRRKRDGRREGSRNELNLDFDPPPDVAIEVDDKADSTKALKLDARLRVPEVWRYLPDAEELWFGRLLGDSYETPPRSVALPRVTRELVLTALAKTEELGTTAAKPSLRGGTRDLPEPAN